MTARLRADCAGRPSVLHLYSIGVSSRNMRPIWMVRVANPKIGTDLRKNLRLFVICRQHGDEPVSTEAALALINKYATCPLSDLPAALAATTLYIIPMANPDGAENLQRNNGMMADMNRDWGPFTQSETQSIYLAYKQVRPQVVVDMHSWTPSDPYRTSCVEVSQAQSGIPQDVSHQALSLQSSILSMAHQDDAVMQPFYYSDKNDPTLCHRFFAEQKGVVSLLMETAAGGITGDAMKSRIALDQSAIGLLLETMANHRGDWLQTAKIEGSEPAPSSIYTETSAQLALLDARPVDHPRPLFVFAKPRLTKGVLRWILAMYFIGCIVLARFAGRAAMRATGTFWRRLTGKSERRAKDEAPVYVSTRRRMYPAKTSR